MSQSTYIKNYNNRIRSAKYLAFVRTLPCCHCGNPETIAHHIIAVDRMGNTGGKADDLSTMPMCGPCHAELHAHTLEWPQTRYMVETQAEAFRIGVIKIG